MIRIYHEVSIDIGSMIEEMVTLWFVAYDGDNEPENAEHWSVFMCAFERWCAQQGWLLDVDENLDAAPGPPILLTSGA